MDSNCNPYQVPSTGETGGDENGNVNSDTGNSGQLFLGFDLSTQQVRWEKEIYDERRKGAKAININE